MVTRVREQERKASQGRLAQVGDASRADHSGAGFRDSGVNTVLTSKPQIECPEYSAAVKRMMSALGRRVARGDIEGLADLAGLTDHLDHVIRETVAALHRDHDYSWAEIGRTLGTSKQGAHRRWSSVRDEARKP